MRTPLIVAAIVGFSVSASAQTAAPKHSGKPLKQARPTAPMACKLVGTVKGTKLWAGDCLAPPELRDTAPAAPAPTLEANPPGCQTIVSCQAPLSASARLVPKQTFRSLRADLLPLATLPARLRPGSPKMKTVAETIAGLRDELERLVVNASACRCCHRKPAMRG